jgi:hypothetical protein
MAHRQSRHHLRARSAFLWTLLFFVLFQLSGAVSVERWLPDARDPDFTLKLAYLQSHRRQAPDRPLVLMLGSSRTSLCFQAGSVQASRGGSPALAFNFGLSGGGPFMELLCLRRLLAAGIRPDLLLVEVLPAMLNQPGQRPLEEQWLQGGRMRLSEIARLEQYLSDPARSMRRWYRSRFLPWPALHRSFQALLVPGWVEPPTGPGEGQVDAHGWEAHFLKGVTEEQRRHLLEIARGQYRDSMGDFHLAEQPVHTLHALLDLCHREAIPVALVLMPEGTEFRAMYPTEVTVGLYHFLSEFSREWNVPLIDARQWVPDRDLWDAHHALPSGAAIFTARLEREVIRPLLRHLPAPPDQSQTATSFHSDL